jgi:protein O-GlcNAc transferase
VSAPSAAADKFLRAALLHRQGRMAEAEALCREVVRAQPRHAGALHILGVAAVQAGRPEEAVRLIRKSLAEEPNQPFAHLNLSAALLGLRRFEAALASCDAALRLAPEEALAYYNRGAALAELKRPLEALASFDRAVQLKPDYFQALHNRGSILAMQNRLAEAVESYDRALRVMPHLVATLNNRGNALEMLKQHEAALDSYQRALRLKPDFVEALTGRGNVLRVLNRFEEALESLERAVQLRPDFPDAWNGRGRVMQALKQPDAALASYERSLQLRPDVPEVLNNRGSALWDLERFDEALASFDRVLSADPRHVEALLNRSNVLKALGRHQEALDGCELALLIRPDFPEGLNMRGNALLGLKRTREALTSFDAALSLRPDYAEALHNRGNALRSLRRLDEALTCLQQAIQLGEQRPEALANYGWVLLELERYEAAATCFARVRATKADSKYALGALHYARVMCCDWTHYQETVEQLAAGLEANQRVSAPFILMAALDAPDAHLRCAHVAAADRFPSSRTPAWRGQRYEHDRIRIAYVSPDLRDHVVTRLLAPLIERHDRRQFEIIGISVRPPEDTAIGQRIRAAFDRFHDISALGDDQVAALMCELEVDIAVDLGGFTGDQRTGIFAQRAAPVQVSYLGYPGSLGADYVHYLLADPVLIPEAERCHYAESIVYLPDCYQVNHAERPLPDPGLTRQGCGLPPEGFVFCCFNNSFKLTPAVFDIWMRILREVEGSVLWLAGHRPSVVRNLHAAAAAHGIASERLVFAEHRPRLEDHLVRYALADLFLDTFPFNAHATASDALWYGVPMVTCIGRAFAGRVAASLLQAVGLPELITHDLQAYEARVLELARSPELLAQMRARLIRNRETRPLFDTERFRHHLELAYRTMWERQQRGELPADFAVQAISSPD